MAESYGFGVGPIFFMSIGAFLLLLLFAGVYIAARVTEVRSEDQRSRHPRGPGFMVAVIGVLSVLGLVLFSTLVYFSRAKTSAILEQDAIARSAVSHESAATENLSEGESVTETSLASSDSSETAGARAVTSDDLPGWTQKPLTVLAEGKVDQVLLVAESELCATADEAIGEAKGRAIGQLLNRIVRDWSELGSWSIPLDLFEAASLREAHTELQMHEFAGRQEPMYRAYVQFEDSARTREQIVDRWKSDVASIRAREFALGVGGLGVALGLISAFLRILLAASERRRKHLTVAVTVVAALSGLGVLFTT